MPLLLKNKIALFILFLFFLVNLLFSFSQYYQEIKFITRHQNASLDEKLLLRYGEFFSLFKMIKKETTPHGNIYFFPGTLNVVKYKALASGFLFPRKIFFFRQRADRARISSKGLVVYADPEEVKDLALKFTKKKQIHWKGKDLSLAWF